ncbi:glycosyltransferase family 2 protein [uncultured Bacteroides sp.]|uniref:glycosyltransferase family A protein n=1 Tax=uncultured Bacteroides sp. TaxID=162156 RepID=UPI0025DD555C|nr:glycosyltransferase family 2 protein [uncultured Bacteroides sp.]
MTNDLTLAICMYNAEKYIEETLQCIIAQTMQDFYLLIVNDCSTDNSVQIVEDFFKRNLRQYELVNLPQNGGLCAGRRFVEEYVTTKYLLFVDADDCPYPSLVEKLYNKISSDGNLMAVGCHLEYMDSNGGKMDGGIFLGETTKEGFYEKAAKEKLIFMQPTAIYDRLLALQVGGHNITGFPNGKPRYQDLCEDLDLWTRMSDLYKKGKAIVVIPEVLCKYRKHEQALSANSLGMILRMRHIKANLKQRRRGEKELSFIEFRDRMSKEELKKLEKDAKSADCLRNAYYCLKKGKLIQFIKYLSVSAFCNPGYAVDKVKHNLLRMK